MSLRATLWAFDDAPVIDTTRKLILLCLADGANDDGAGTYPGVGLMARRACCSEKTVKRHLEALEQEGLIRRGDQNVAARTIPRRDRRPVVWDLDLDRIKDGGDAPTHRQVPSRAPRNPRNQYGPIEPKGSAGYAGSTTASDSERGDMMSPREDAQVSTGGHGESGPRGDIRGDMHVPQYVDPKSDDDDARERANAAPVDNNRQSLGSPSVDLLADALASHSGRVLTWDLNPAQVNALSEQLIAFGDVQPLVEIARDQDEAHMAGRGDPARRASAFYRAWMRARPVPVEFDRSHRERGAQPPSRPPWCGACDEPTRIVEGPDGRGSRCPTCHPKAVAGF